jgi:hypothetical protein
MAEGVGFEPTRELAPPAGFQDRCLKPLGHPSKANQINALSSLRTVTPRTLLPHCYQIVRPTRFTYQALRSADNAALIASAAFLSSLRKRWA